MPPVARRSATSSAFSIQTRNTVLIACIAVALFIATTTVSYIVFKVLATAGRFQRGSRRQPVSSSLPGPGVPAMGSNNHNLFVKRGCTSTSTLQSASPLPSTVPPNIPRPMPPTQKTIWRSRFPILPWHLRNNIRSSLSTPSSLSTTQPSSNGGPPLPTLHKAQWDPTRPPRTPSVIQEAANNVVGAHPFPESIPTLAPPFRLASPKLGHQFHLDFPWVTENLNFGLVTPGSTLTAVDTEKPSQHAVGCDSLWQVPGRGEEGQVVRVLHDTSNGGVRMEQRPSSPPPFLEINGKYPKPALPPRAASRSRTQHTLRETTVHSQSQKENAR